MLDPDPDPSDQVPRIEVRSSLLMTVVAGIGIGIGTYFFSESPLVVVLGGLGYLVLIVRTAQRRLIVDDHGVTTRDRLVTRTIAWSDVAYVLYSSRGRGSADDLVTTVLAIGAAVADRKRRDHRHFIVGELVLVSRSGSKVSISQRFRRVERALDMIFAVLHRQFDRDTAPFTLGTASLDHPDASLPYAEIECVELGGDRLVIRRRGQREPFANLRMATVHNVLELVDLLARRGVAVTIATNIFLPRHMVSKAN